MYAYRNPQFNQRGFFLGIPFAGALLGGLVGGAVGSAFFRPYPFLPYSPYGAGAFPPYGGFGYGIPYY